MFKQTVLPGIILLLGLVACSNGTSTPADPTKQAATAEVMIAATRTAAGAATPAATRETSAADTASEPSAKSRGDLIAFWRDDKGIVDIFVLDPDTGEQINLTQNPGGHEFRPVWSPNGRLIAFLSDRMDNWDIYYAPVDLDGGSGAPARALTISMNPDIFPRWSPDGKSVTYYTFYSGQYDIIRVNLETHRQANLTAGTKDSSETHPLWSPDGEEILFISDRDGGNDEYYLMSKDGWNVRRLTETPDAAEWDAAWSPDGAQIAFVSDRDGNAEIYLMRADGSDVRRVTENQVDDGIPVWSPDGRSLLLVSNREGNTEIYRLDIDCAGSAEGCEGQMLNLTNDEAVDSLPVWSPDGSRIAFISTRDGNEDLFLMAADGSNPINLTKSEAQEWLGEWAPRPEERP